MGYSNCGKTYLINFFLFLKQEPGFVKTESINRNPNVKSRTSDQIQPLQNYENSIVNYDDMLLLKQASNFDLFFTRTRNSNSDKYCINHSYYHLPKIEFRYNSNEFVLLKQV